jgi:hypothetical protein
MAARLGQVLYWTATGISILVLAFAAYEAITFGPETVVLMAQIGIAAVTWLIGRALLYVLPAK